jgi:hypothetical protein
MTFILNPGELFVSSVTVYIIIDMLFETEPNFFFFSKIEFNV